MSAPDFFFGVNEIFRHIHDQHGKERLIDYWRKLGTEHYRQRNARWKQGSLKEVARDWQNYFDHEPGADVAVRQTQEAVHLDIRVCPAIHHLKQQQRDIVPYYCEHCDHICGQQAQQAGMRFEREGGMGSCQQRFIKLATNGETPC